MQRRRLLLALAAAGAAPSHPAQAVEALAIGQWVALPEVRRKLGSKA